MLLFRRHTVGFTIVELIIVTVVTGILATIVLVSYGQIERRAENTRVLASVKNWQQIIRTYQVFNGGKLPDDWTCLGVAVTDFPVDNAYNLGLGMCERGMIVSDTWTSEYKTVPPQPNKPAPTPDLLRRRASPGSGSMKSLVHGPKIIKGIIYASVSSQTQVSHPGAYLFYGLNDQPCPAGEAHKIHGKINICAHPLTPSTKTWIQVIDV